MKRRKGETDRQRHGEKKEQKESNQLSGSYEGSRQILRLDATDQREAAQTAAAAQPMQIDPTILYVMRAQQRL